MSFNNITPKEYENYISHKALLWKFFECIMPSYTPASSISTLFEESDTQSRFQLTKYFLENHSVNTDLIYYKCNCRGHLKQSFL